MASSGGFRSFTVPKQGSIPSSESFTFFSESRLVRPLVPDRTNKLPGPCCWVRRDMDFRTRSQKSSDSDKLGGDLDDMFERHQKMHKGGARCPQLSAYPHCVHLVYRCTIELSVRLSAFPDFVHLVYWCNVGHGVLGSQLIMHVCTYCTGVPVRTI